MRRAWSNARRMIGTEPSSKTGVETGTKKLMGKSCVQESNELPKCQDASAASSVLPNPETSIYNPRPRYAVSIGWGCSRPTEVTAPPSAAARADAYPDHRYA